MVTGKTLGEYIEKWHVKKADWKGGHELEVLGVSNVDGITTTSHVKSKDLSGYLVVEPNAFAYNPYRINVGSIGLTPNNVFGVVSPAYVVFKVKEDKLIPELLLEFLKSFDGLQQINKYARGTVRKALRFDDLCKIEVNFPDYSQQQNIFEKKLIVEKKSDELGSQIQTQKNLLSQLKQSILQEAIHGKLTADWRKQNPGVEPASELLKRIKAEKAQLIKDKKIRKEKALAPITEEEIPFELPEGWVWCRIQDISALKSGNSYKYAQGSVNDIPYVKVGDMNIPGNFKDVTNSSNFFVYQDSMQKDLINPKSIIFPKRGGAIATNKRCNVLSKKILIDSNSMAVIPSELIDFDFFSWWFKTIDLSTLGNEAVVPQVNNKDILPIPFPLPPLNEQKAIVEKVESLMRKCQSLEEEIKTSEANAQMLMQAVLKEAFEGKVEAIEV